MFVEKKLLPAGSKRLRKISECVDGDLKKLALENAPKISKTAIESKSKLVNEPKLKELVQEAKKIKENEDSVKGKQSALRKIEEDKSTLSDNDKKTKAHPKSAQAS